MFCKHFRHFLIAQKLEAFGKNMNRVFGFLIKNAGSCAPTGQANSSNRGSCTFYKISPPFFRVKANPYILFFFHWFNFPFNIKKENENIQILLSNEKRKIPGLSFYSLVVWRKGNQKTIFNPEKTVAPGMV
jgi:hypothetical protein